MPAYQANLRGIDAAKPKMEILLFTSFIVITCAFYYLLRIEKLYIRLLPVFFLILFLGGHALIEWKFEKLIFLGGQDDQTFFINNGKVCNEGNFKNIRNPFELEKNFAYYYTTYPFTFTSCLFHRYSYSPIFTLRFFNFLLFISMILLIYQSVLIVTQSRKYARLAGLLVCLSSSLILYQFYILREMAMCFLSALTIFFAISAFYHPKKVFLITISIICLLLTVHGQYLLRKHIILISIMFITNLIGLVVIERKKYRIIYFFLIFISFLFFWNYLAGDFFKGKFEFLFFLKNPSHIIALTKEFLLNFSGIGFIIPSYGVNDSLLTWVLKRSLTFDRLLYPSIFLYFLIRLKLKEKILFFLLSVPGYYLYEAVYYYAREYYKISLGFGFRHAIPFYIYFPFFIPWMAFLHNKNCERKRAKVPTSSPSNV